MSRALICLLGLGILVLVSCNAQSGTGGSGPAGDSAAASETFRVSITGMT